MLNKGSDSDTTTSIRLFPKLGGLFKNKHFTS